MSKCCLCKYYYTHPFYSTLLNITSTTERCKLKGHRELKDIKELVDTNMCKEITLLVLESVK